MKKALTGLLMLPALSLAHEPIFGLGPGTIFKGGVGIEAEYEREGTAEGIATELLYGLTEDVSLTLRAFVGFRGAKGYAGRIKWRFWKRYAPGTVDALAVIGGAVRTPDGKTYPLVATAVGHESRRWYFFADIRSADKFYFDTAVGIRPWLTEYLKPDLVLLTELNYELKDRYRVLFVSPAFFFTYRNLAVKGGVQFPVSKSDVAGGVEERVALSAEIHF